MVLWVKTYSRHSWTSFFGWTSSCSQQFWCEKHVGLLHLIGQFLTARLSIVDVDIHWSSWRHEPFGLAIYDDSTIPNHSINLRSLLRCRHRRPHRLKRGMTCWIWWITPRTGKCGWLDFAALRFASHQVGLSIKQYKTCDKPKHNHSWNATG